MPLYEYKCGECGRVVEVLQDKWAASPPKCCNVWMVKLVSVTGMPQFKGTGWTEKS